MGGGKGVQNKKNVPWGEYGYFLKLHNVDHDVLTAHWWLIHCDPDQSDNVVRQDY